MALAKSGFSLDLALTRITSSGVSWNTRLKRSGSTKRTVSSTGGFVVAGQRIQLGRGHARQVVTAHLDETSIRIFQGTELITTVPRITRKEVVIRTSGEHHRRKIV